MMMQMRGAFAEFERAMIRERTSSGLAHCSSATNLPTIYEFAFSSRNGASSSDQKIFLAGKFKIGNFVF
jgi:DNA invertase Pin-like site-specific DNA recombinase